MVQFLRIFFRWFSLILPALFQLLPHRVLDRLLWVRARLFVQAVRSPFGFFSTKFFRKFRDLVQVNRVPSDYSWEWHTQESVVYVRTKHVGPGSATQFCIGSTADTIHRRELSRRRKYLQLCRGPHCILRTCPQNLGLSRRLLLRDWGSFTSGF